MSVSIVKLKSIAAGHVFFSIQLTDETYVGPYGAASLSSIEKNEVVLAEYNAIEYQVLFENIPKGSTLFEQRINHELGRTDLRSCWFLRREEISLNVSHLSYYKDIHTDTGEAIKVSDLSLEDYLEGGGSFVDLRKKGDQRVPSMDSDELATDKHPVFPDSE